MSDHEYRCGRFRLTIESGAGQSWVEMEDTQTDRCLVIDGSLLAGLAIAFEKLDRDYFSAENH